MPCLSLLAARTRFCLTRGGISSIEHRAPLLPTAFPPPAAAALAGARSAHRHGSMGQKSIDSFFQRPASAAKAASGMPGAARGDDAAAPPAAEARAPDAAQPSASLQQGAAAADVSAERLVNERQLLRAHANRNAALAKQVVARAQAAGGAPRLADLLVEDSWRQLLAGEMGKPYFAGLEAFVAGEWAGGQQVFPPKECIFRALNSCPVDKVRVVILGQDPYHGPGLAMGLSFSVPQGVAVPSSLKNMYKELFSDLGCPVPKSGDLSAWSQQGVLLLNAVLTVRSGSAASHAKKGWEGFTDAVISQLSQQRSGIVFLLWGRYAQEKGKVIDRRKHHVLTAAHPSGLSANRGFFGCKHFSQANALLEQGGQLPINWRIE